MTKGDIKGLPKHRFRHQIRRQRISRSRAGNALMFLFLFVCASFTALPLIYALTTAFKPLDELWRFPPHIVIVNHPTMKNFKDMVAVMSNSWVPFSRYIFNSFFITAIGTAGNVVFAAMAAYPLAKKHFPGSTVFFNLIVFSLMFTPAVTSIPSYLVMSTLGWIDSYSALIIPAFGSTLGLYLLRQFMTGVPDAVLEAGKMDGANEWVVFWRIVMPQVKPAWLTAMIFSVQALWNSGSSNFIYSEKLKTLPYAMSQIVSAGIARAGVGAASTVILMAVPIIIFMFAQSNIVETMASSGIKE
jgi:ABC-type glycerol-3-phosphate transport system permease component